MRIRRVYGVDFSGARLAGKNLWVAGAEVRAGGRLVLVELVNVGRACGTDERGPVLRHLVGMVRGSEGALWGMDFPFGLPVEVMPDGATWADQLALVRGWGEDAYALGVEFTRRCYRLLGRLHVRRRTDTETKAPFDCYHYRIIYQTFYGMRDVLGPLARSRGTAVLPFQYGRLARARRVVTEACPASVLKRVGLPSQNYKQAAGGPLTAKRLRVRRAVVEGLAGYIEVGPAARRVMMRNPGGDALDAVIAAAGVWDGWRQTDHAAVRRDGRYVREGRAYG